MGLNKPPLNQLLDKVDSKYTLIVVAAKRAREFIEAEANGVQTEANPVSKAFEEIAAGKVVWERIQECDEPAADAE